MQERKVANKMWLWEYVSHQILENLRSLGFHDDRRSGEDVADDDGDGDDGDGDDDDVAAADYD